MTSDVPIRAPTIRQAPFDFAQGRQGKPHGRGAARESEPCHIPNSKFREKEGPVYDKLRNEAKKFFVINKSFPQKPKATAFQRSSLDCHRREAPGPACCVAGPELHRMEKTRIPAVRGRRGPLERPIFELRDWARQGRGKD